MLVTLQGNVSTTIEDGVVKRILEMYPEEQLWTRAIFERAFRTGLIDLNELKVESAKVLIPWHMFLLDQKNFQRQIKHIEDQRKHKVSKKLLSKRKGLGNTTSKRIIDRLIRQQHFLLDQRKFSINDYCGSLARLSTSKAAQQILNHFGIDREEYWQYEQEKALDYLIKRIEQKNINVCRGVLAHKLLPNHQVVSNVYKNTSGFVVQDDRMPFIFLPSDINPDEIIRRQLYTLVYLLVIIGLNYYDYLMETNFRFKSARQSKKIDRIHAITSELLIPQSELNRFREQEITPEIRDAVCRKLKVTPSALLLTMKIRGLIDDAKHKELKPPEFESGHKLRERRSTPHVRTAIKKFCGTHTYDALCFAIKTRSLPNTQAQYLIFGSINKKTFRRFRAEIEE